MLPPPLTDSKSGAEEDKNKGLCSGSPRKPVAELSANRAFESLLIFLPLASIAAPFSITFLFHYFIS